MLPVNVVSVKGRNLYFILILNAFEISSVCHYPVPNFLHSLLQLLDIGGCLGACADLIIVEHVAFPHLQGREVRHDNIGPGP